MIELLIEPDPTYGSLLVTVIVVVLVILSLCVLAAAFSEAGSNLKSNAIALAIISTLIGAMSVLVMTGVVYENETYAAVKEALPGELLSGDVRNPPFLVKTSTGVEQWTLDIDRQYLILLEKY